MRILIRHAPILLIAIILIALACVFLSNSRLAQLEFDLNPPIESLRCDRSFYNHYQETSACLHEIYPADDSINRINVIYQGDQIFYISFGLENIRYGELVHVLGLANRVDRYYNTASLSWGNAYAVANVGRNADLSMYTPVSSILFVIKEP